MNSQCNEEKQTIFTSGGRRRGARMAVGGCKLSEDSLKTHRSGVKLHSTTPHLAWPQGVFGGIPPLPNLAWALICIAATVIALA